MEESVRIRKEGGIIKVTGPMEVLARKGELVIYPRGVAEAKTRTETSEPDIEIVLPGLPTSEIVVVPEEEEKEEGEEKEGEEKEEVKIIETEEGDVLILCREKDITTERSLALVNLLVNHDLQRITIVTEKRKITLDEMPSGVDVQNWLQLAVDIATGVRSNRKHDIVALNPWKIVNDFPASIKDRAVRAARKLADRYGFDEETTGFLAWRLAAKTLDAARTQRWEDEFARIVLSS
ncbi:hypothetical protein Ferp_0511 [Ferroglobus placidus DSM 10642]|uniref:Uncharacterized protein n=1 Tax=Ferroglobus placidus (strain DSM 10642 / AEDII12DO) TaxID=589924 RepID=D3S352_FERPA|nr:hypothetical protein [Ferroglobus placidus]ADC64685.1 hypothetical protein Ferp_0511 [Ferroglobus placidus DSM 10642]